MPISPATLSAPQAATRGFVERREVSRVYLPAYPVLSVAARPKADPFMVSVKDISPKGVCLFSPEPIEPTEGLIYMELDLEHSAFSTQRSAV